MSPAPALVARRNAFTGRVSYVDASGARGLRIRVPRPVLAAASLAAMAAGLAFSGPGSAPTSPTAAENVTPQTVSLGDRVDALPRWSPPQGSALQGAR